MRKGCYPNCLVEKDGLGEALGHNERLSFCHLFLPMLLERQQTVQWQPFPAHITQVHNQHLQGHA